MHTSMMMAVNSPPVVHRDPSTNSYRLYNDDYEPRIQRAPQPVVQEVETERSKKDKKWSLGKLFRRKKKNNDSVSSSDSNEDASTQSLSKRKAKKKKKTPVSNFDHIVMRETRRAQSLMKHRERDFIDEGVLSDPSAGFINYRSKYSQDPYTVSKESLNSRDEILSKSGTSSAEVVAKKTRKGRLKARVEALRNSMRADSSSDEESLKSSNSSMVRFRSEDSLMRSRDSSLNKRSRSARNERYIKRLSRDEENQLNKEAELLQQGYTKAEVEMLTRTPTSQSSGYGTYKRENQNTRFKPEQIYANGNSRRPMKSDSISSFPSTQSYPSSINFNAKVNNDHVNYSVQYTNNNLNRDNVYTNNNRERTPYDQRDDTNNIMHVKFPLGNVTNIKRDEREPPAPPPRDMHRKVVTPLSMYYENNPIVTDRMGNNRTIVHGVPNNDFERVMRRSQERSLNPVINGLRRPISTSEDHIAMQNYDGLQNYQLHKGEQPRRPASVSAEPNHYSLYSNTPPWRKKFEQQKIIKPEPIQPRHDYLYYADRSPRSRRPISIQSNGQNVVENQYLSDSQASLNMGDNIYRRPRNASDFWKKLDDAEKHRKQHTMYIINGRSNSEGPNVQRYKHILEQSKTNNEPLEKNGDYLNKNKLSLHTKSRDTTDDAKMWKATTEYKRSVTVEPPKNDISPSSKTHVRHKSDTSVPNNYQMFSDDEKNSERRKSTNLDDALNELEAIYNSLGLGDEDLLDRAERRELMSPKVRDSYNDWNGNDEVQLRSQPTTPLRRIQRRSTLPDKLQDDMAFRRLNSKERPLSKDTQSQMSYMLTSPVYVPYVSDDDRHSELDKNEPDIVYDDVVYRNIKQANSHLKTLEPQPPFGIPLGPVSPAPQSDYLHATPETKPRSRFLPRKSPDLVSDDLAYRSLRKDNNRQSSVFNVDDFSGHINNNHSYNDLIQKDLPTNIKKKRAVRSLSANIFTMIQKEIDDALNSSKAATLQKTNSNGDVNRRLRETKENNDYNRDHYPRNKVKQRHNTVSLFVNNIHSPSHHFAKDDSYIHSDNKYLAKPPSCDKSKSSSPSTRSPQSSKRSSKDEFQQVLTMLAQEAMDTSNKLGVALAELDKNKSNSDRKTDIQNKLSDSRMNFLNGLRNADPEIKFVNIYSEVVNGGESDKCSVIKQDDCKAKKTEDSLLAISDQLQKVENKLKHSYEKEVNIEDESLKLSEYISEPENQTKAQETIVFSPENKIIPDVVPVSVSNDVVNVQNRSMPIDKPEEAVVSKCNLRTQSNVNDQIKGINEINAFKELKSGISDLIAGINQVNDKLFSTNTANNDVPISKVTGITEASEKLNEVTENLKMEKPVNRASVNLSIYEDDLVVKKDAVDSNEYNSSEELATIFNLETNSRKKPKCEESNESNNVRNDLNSPKLVQSVNQQLRRFSVDNNDNVPSQSTSLCTNVVPWRTKRQPGNSQRGDDGDNSDKSSWNESPSTLMLTYLYTLIFSQHLADLDWLTLLGLLLAIITILAMLII